MELAVLDTNTMTLRLRKAALLLFAKNIREWHPYCGIRMFKVRGTRVRTGVDFNATLLAELQGNLVELLDKSWPTLRPFVANHDQFFIEEARFKKQTHYAKIACQEALHNALLHRDYHAEGRSIEIFLYDDRLEIRNPGALPAPLTTEALTQLNGVRESRNPTLVRTLRRCGYIRGTGEGLRLLFQQPERGQLVVPKIRSQGASFAVHLYKRPIWSAEQLDWLSNFEISKAEKIVLALGTDGRLFSQSEGTEHLQEEGAFQRVVERLKQKNFLIDHLGRSEASRVKKSLKPELFHAIPRYEIVLPQQSPCKVVNDSYSNSATIRISALPVDGVERSAVEALFRPFGFIIYTVIIQEATSAHALVRFKTPTQAQAALNTTTPIVLKGHMLTISPHRPHNKR